MIPNFFGSFKRKQNTNDVKNCSTPRITQEMEDEVMASARATIDTNTVSRAISYLIEDDNNVDSNRNEFTIKIPAKRGKNRLRELATGLRIGDSQESTWDNQQIALASGTTTFFLSPLIIPIMHSLLPPIIPSPSSISITGAALLGTISYIVALGDTSEQSNPIPGMARGVLGDGVEVGGAVSRILGRTTLQSVQTAAPRLKAAARAIVDYESTAASLEELRCVQEQLLQSVTQLEMENGMLRRELALWQAAENVSNAYKLEELKELARHNGLKGYSSDGKTTLMRRLAKEGILNLDLRSN